MKLVRRVGWAVTALGLALAARASASEIDTGQLLYFAAREQLRRIDLDTLDDPPIVEDTLIASTGDDEHGLAGPRGGGNVNGTLCVLADGTHRMVMGEDAG